MPSRDELSASDRLAPSQTRSLLDAIDHHFATHPACRLLILDDAWRADPHWYPLCQSLGAPRVLRESFYQRPWQWLVSDYAAQPFDIERGRPRRPPKPRGAVYERFDPRLEQRLTLRVCEHERDLDRLHQWMQQERVARFWQQNKPYDAFSDWLDKRLAEPHRLSLIGELDGEAFGYFELYWAPEDVLGEYYDWQAFDRGLHVLVGEDSFRGAHFVDGWLAALQHYAYLSEPRTDRVVLEPDAGNERIFRHLERLGLFSQWSFDLPDKRAMLVMGTRHHFFGQVM
ncbi:acetyl CoA:N6-hydroxylysine acetyl transferase [Kushneria avicenniae]|uniref:Acetyl CoA:N6-hydroxylysine acetyl transferase n=1 Tax=Kushneria avicenniae TaxID=402385 RepID=A0A1I1LYP3_9GAMM|nr:GNAT family N-acetyltransferase [Kushneria avicenniae]SFC75443.1 acetyl CoA:N6-hydroxylysine acetyl transferase [Kushneria avicenniae]